MHSSTPFSLAEARAARASLSYQQQRISFADHAPWMGPPVGDGRSVSVTLYAPGA